MAGDTETALRQLLDRQEIVDLLLRYASAIDAKDYTTLRSLFCDDIHARYGEDVVVDGGDALLAWIDDMTKTATWQHHMLNVYHVDFVSDTEATTLTYHTSHQTTSDAPDICRKIVARYYDTVRKVDGRWLIADKYMQIGWTQAFTADSEPT
jgi:ketosteroid isomerase-like protein